MPLLSVIVPSKNRPDSLVRLLDSILRQDYGDLEIVVIDDGSTPSISILRAGVKLIRNEKSRGLCAVRNQGRAVARGEFIAYFDDDAEISDPTLLRRALRWMSDRPDCGAVAFRQLRPDGSEDYMQPAHESAPCFAAHFFGYGFLMRAQVFTETGGFAEAFGYYQDEAEMSIRIMDAGYAIIYDPSLSVTHFQDPRGRDLTIIYRLSLRNGIMMALLRYPLWCIPPAVGASIVRHLRWTRANGHVDYLGLKWALSELTSLFGLIRSERKPVSFGLLRRRRRLSRHPERVTYEPQTLRI
jgi:glycosyltransferase involved in cell wall biosynthesis